MYLLWLVASLGETIFNLIAYLKICHNLKRKKSNPVKLWQNFCVKGCISSKNTVQRNPNSKFCFKLWNQLKLKLTKLQRKSHSEFSVYYIYVYNTVKIPNFISLNLTFCKLTSWCSKNERVKSQTSYL